MQVARNAKPLDSSDEITPASNLRSIDEGKLPTLSDEADDDGDVTTVGPQLTREGVLSLMDAAEAPHEKDTVVPPPPRESEIRAVSDSVQDVYSDDPECEPTSPIGAARPAPTRPVAIDIPTPPPFPTSGRTVRIAPDVLASVRSRSPLPPALAPIDVARAHDDPSPFAPPRRERRAAAILLVVALAIVLAGAVPGSPARPLIEGLVDALVRL